MTISTIPLKIIVPLIALIVFSCTDEKVRQAAYEKPAIIADPPVDFLTPEESMKTFYLPEGYQVALVASEPMINEPVGMAWDADGKLYVAQMDTYMQDIDGTDENMPWSSIILLEDLDDDGKMDKRTVFIDSLILPRIIMPLDDQLIIGETYDRRLWSYRDTNGDGIADEKKLLFDTDVRDNANLEHQAASMVWNIDNYMYVSKNPFRFKYSGKLLELDTMQNPPYGQWGLTQDEVGQLYYSRAGGEIPALGFQIPPIYGDVTMNGQLEEGFQETWPVTGTPDVQGGLKRLREDGTLNHFTASCGQEVFLGDQLPAYGDLFIPEPVGRMIRQAKVDRVNGKKVLRNAYEQTEFMASTDLNFRPVDMKTGPDGCLYVVDMYRGIIQEGKWVRKGSFLRPVVERKKLDKNIGKGRIYRITHRDFTPSKKEKLLKKSSSELLPYLGHANGWYRINAQKLIVLKQDLSVVDQLKELALETDGLFKANKDYGIQRLHALWTLQGLEALDKDFLLEKLSDDDYRVKAAAVRMCEPFLANGDEAIFNQLSKMISEESGDVRLQLGLSMRSSDNPEAKDVIRSLVKNDRHHMLIASTGAESLREDPPAIEQIRERHKLQTSSIKKSIIRGYKNYHQICADCHGKDGKGQGDLAPALVGSPRVTGNVEKLTRILLNGLTGPIDNKQYSGVMVSMKNHDDQWIADVLTYIRMELNSANPVRTWHITRIRKTVKEREDYWTLEELLDKP